MIQVVIVDDHPVAQRGMAAILQEPGDMTVTRCVPAVAGLSEDTLDADVLLLDLYQDGDEPCLADIARLAATVKVLVISASGRPADVLGAIRAGASGYVTKTAQPQALVAAVRTVAAGGFALSSKLADILRAGLDSGRQETAATDGPPLSPREEEALDLIAQGYTHAQAARRMGVSKATVDTYVERIRAKLQVGNKAEMTRAAVRRAGDRASR